MKTSERKSALIAEILMVAKTSNMTIIKANKHERMEWQRTTVNIEKLWLALIFKSELDLIGIAHELRIPIPKA